MDFSSLTPAGMQHPKIKQFLAVKNNTKSNPEHLACLEGLWEVSNAFREKLDLRGFFVCPELLRGDAGRTLAERIVASGAHAYVVSPRVMERLSDRDDPDGLAAIVQLPRFAFSDLQLKDRMNVMVLDGLEIPGNIGTIIRCADAVGADGVIITNRRTRLSHPKLLHSSMGSSFTFPVIEAPVENAIAWLNDHDFAIITTDTDAPLNYRNADYCRRVAIVMGSERYGIVKAWNDAADQAVSIPMAGKIDSLNVGNAAVLMLYEVFFQQQPERFAER
jgi:RNA methyltransferase, TrmH family